MHLVSESVAVTRALPCLFSSVVVVFDGEDVGITLVSVLAFDVSLQLVVL